MSWIKTINYEDADSNLKRIYDRVKGPNNKIDNVLLIHSLRPHALVGHMTLYKSVLHNSNNELPKWYLESIGVYVSHLNKCNYCVEHHFTGLKSLLKDDIKADHFLEAVKNDTLEAYFDSKYFKGMYYAKKLTLELENITKEDIESLKTLGFSDGEILEINQVTSYFNYVNRTVIGLGINTKRDILGLAPKEGNDPENWNHK
ncbi:MAG: alkylhydroperoxidase [Flavobacteriales bacterium]|nr:MAG: alkylhydroperoxidase [Flavobacteriales bacterium]